MRCASARLIARGTPLSVRCLSGTQVSLPLTMRRWPGAPSSMPPSRTVHTSPSCAPRRRRCGRRLPGVAHLLRAIGVRACLDVERSLVDAAAGAGPVSTNTLLIASRSSGARIRTAISLLAYKCLPPHRSSAVRGRLSGITLGSGAGFAAAVGIGANFAGVGNRP
jgi:hypothetical protein